MSNYAISLKRTTLLLLALAFTAVLTVANLSIFSIGRAGAAQLTSRSLSLASSLDGTETTGAADSETNGSNTTHTFTFTMPTDVTVEAILFKYCTTAIGACTMPTDMSAASSTLTSTSFTGTFVNDTTSLQTEDAECSVVANAQGRDNCVGITNATGASEGTGAETVVIAGMKNPESIGTFFVRISVFAVDDYTSLQHDGTVASSTTNGIAITSRVVETLGFSTEAGTSLDDPSTNCSPLTGTGALSLGQAPDYTLAINATYDAYSAWRLYTNSANGTVVQYEGATLTKGADVIDAIGGTAAAPVIGSEQFGLAADLTADSAAITYANTTEGGAGQVNITADYDGGHGTIASGTFAFVADTKTTLGSSSSYVTCDTYAMQYIANISPLTPAGTYTTTIVYFAVPTY
jgi:hypothetical protein